MPRLLRVLLSPGRHNENLGSCYDQTTFHGDRSIYWFRNLIVGERNTSTPGGTMYKHAFLYGARKPKNEINFYDEIKRIRGLAEK
jgi:hypothetical protein